MRKKMVAWGCALSLVLGLVTGCVYAAQRAEAVAVGDTGTVWLTGVPGSATCDAYSGDTEVPLYWVGDARECTIVGTLGQCNWINYAPGAFACKCTITVTGVSGADCAGINQSCCWTR